MTQKGTAAKQGQSCGQETTGKRRLPIGAELDDGAAHFRVWAPKRRAMDAVLLAVDGSQRRCPLDAEDNGYFSGAAAALAGERYWLRPDNEDRLLPDPVSRFQPEGPHGPSELVEPGAFQWHDGSWTGPAATPVIYEMHIGSFTPEGTWLSAARHLAALREIGITIVEVMPVAEFPGRFGWGYDGVDLFAPSHLYGRPDDFRRFVDAAHGLGLGVILDVVYNHLGPDGNYLTQFTDQLFTDRYECEWGAALNFDDQGCEGVREFVLANVRYWIDEFHLDGLRLDATQQIFDASSPHILREIGRVARESAISQRRHVYIVCENEPQDARLVRPAEQGGYDLDALWNDDLHHCAKVAATGQAQAYFSGYSGSPQEFVSAAKYGFLYQGQHYKWQGKGRGTPALDIAPERFVNFIQNHDQIANTGMGERLHELTGFGRYKALTALFILMPGTPMLFQGQEFAASTPFTYFADHKPDLARVVRQGRAEFLAQFPNLAVAEVAAALPDPADPENFRRCILDHNERTQGRHAQVLALHRDLIRLRAEDEVLRRPARLSVDGAVLGMRAFVLRWRGKDFDRLLLINLGGDLRLDSPAEPLLAPPTDARWHILWSSETLAYGGRGTAELEAADHWLIPGRAAVMLRSTTEPPRASSPSEPG